ncbi:homoserine O-acetyltransferase [Alkalispirochaeta americana]|uniref:Homoserine O-acetyltransferase n=1 Tax=Alkalispirochaeta americana TaxID=159291 RepID=A0A1N6WF40_9SPIO|nr:homoserine O-acetyltransferase [Alkalispirochaeta americana]SIQ88612.1 homoserine O-acetyltransferase [Alkalispirochaeta americana]
MEQSPNGLVVPRTIQLEIPPGGFPLESGKTLPEVVVQYETYGKLNENRDNTILLLHAFSGDAHAAGLHTPRDRHPGWWDDMVRPGGAFDTNKFFVICSNVLGGCRGTTGPGSKNPTTGIPWAMSFPTVTIGDMVEVQRQLLRQLGIDRLHATAGGSMGGMQALEWAIRYPGIAQQTILLASTHRLGAQGIAFNAVGRNAITSDPNWNKGNYYDGPQPSRGLAIARMVGHITYLSSESMRRKFGRRLQETHQGEEKHLDLQDQFAVESYLEYQGEKFVDRFDANSYIYLSKALDYYDAGASRDGLEAALARTDSRFLVLSYSSDWLFPTDQSKEIVYALARAGKDVSFNEINSPYGHDSFLLESHLQRDLISAFLEGGTS